MRKGDSQGSGSSGPVKAEDDETRPELEAFLTQRMTELHATSDPYRITHTVQVTSFGGSGTTALCNHLLAAGIDLQPGPAQWPFKHRREPPRADEAPDGFRVVYLIGEPRDAVLSIFRRGLQIGHYRSLRGAEPDAGARARLETLESFLAAGIDDFALSDHVDRWLGHPEGYPVLFVRYEQLGAAWNEVSAFVGLAADHAPMPTRTRRSNRRAVRSPQREQLDALYGELAARIDALPPTHVVDGRTPRP